MEPWAKMSSFHLHEKYAKQKKIKYTDVNLHNCKQRLCNRDDIANITQRIYGTFSIIYNNSI